MSTPPPIPRVELAYTPTPLLKLERLSSDLGVELWVKRDDLTGLLETGGTVRKLEFLVGEALSRCGSAAVYKAAVARCVHAATPADVEFLVEHDYAARTGPEARAAWLATARHIRADFVERRADYRRALATLDLPVLFVHGRQDPAVAPRHAGEAAAGVPRAALRWVDACGHFPHLEHPRTVNGWLAEFLVGHTAAR